MAKDKKELSLRGKQTRAGKLLSTFIRQIAEEVTEVVVDPVTGEDRMATKAEGLARLMWKKALGYKETNIVEGSPVDTTYHADKFMMGMLFDRMEGRAPVTVGDSDGKMTTAERVSELGKKRIAQAGGLSKE